MREIVCHAEGEIDPLGYLMIWCGIVGTSVGLSLPKEIVIEQSSLNG